MRANVEAFIEQFHNQLEKLFELALVLARFAPSFRLPAIAVAPATHVANVNLRSRDSNRNCVNYLSRPRTSCVIGILKTWQIRSKVRTVIGRPPRSAASAGLRSQARSCPLE